MGHPVRQLGFSVAARLSTFRLTAPTWSQPAPAAAYTANIVPFLQPGKLQLGTLKLLI